METIAHEVGGRMECHCRRAASLRGRSITAADALVREWLGASERDDFEPIANLDVLLELNAKDPVLYCEVLPRLPKRMLERYCAILPERLAAVWAQLVVHTSGELPFELCGRVAHLHARVFTVASEERLRRDALDELLRLGPSHRSYAAGEAVRGVLWKVRRERDVALVAEAIAESPYSWWYAHPKLLDGSLAPAIKAALRLQAMEAALRSESKNAASRRARTRR